VRLGERGKDDECREDRDDEHGTAGYKGKDEDQGEDGGEEE
jgi:hypothetical protein